MELDVCGGNAMAAVERASCNIQLLAPHHAALAAVPTRAASENVDTVGLPLERRAAAMSPFPPTAMMPANTAAAASTSRLAAATSTPGSPPTAATSTPVPPSAIKNAVAAVTAAATAETAKTAATVAAAADAVAPQPVPALEREPFGLFVEVVMSVGLEGVLSTSTAAGLCLTLAVAQSFARSFLDAERGSQGEGAATSTDAGTVTMTTATGGGGQFASSPEASGTADVRGVTAAPNGHASEGGGPRSGDDANQTAAANATATAAFGTRVCVTSLRVVANII
jgi:hypothetical protein